MAVTMRRPAGIIIIGFLQLINGLLVGANVLLTDTIDPNLTQMLTTSLGFLNVIFAIGLWMLWRWAWVATMLGTGFSLALGLLHYWQGDPNYAAMMVNILIVFYLNLREVQHVFEPAR
jgi:uncharacterized membrane protein (DUF2068 family)